ncbi:MAG: apolipoprotein N-acyltransferase [Emcibacter sp.]|nr:apolipoprotein N-acyltransferase [Emcibacter sp.]
MISMLLTWLDQRSSTQRMGLLLVAGLLNGFSFAPFYFFPVLAVTYPLLLLILFKSQRLSEAFCFGWWFSFSQLFMGTIWIASAFEVDSRYSLWVGYLAVACLAMILALYSGLATGLLWHLYHRRNLKDNAWSIVLSFVVFWTIAEWLRGNLFTGFPWNLTGYVWGFSDIMLQTSAMWGIYGLGLITIFLALIPYMLIVLSSSRRSIYSILIVGGLIVGCLISYGMVQLSGPTKFRDDVKLKIVQANINQEDKWDPEKKADNFIKYLNMSKSNPEEGITHVIWPETAVIYFLDSEPSRRYLIADILNEDALLMTGFPRIERRPEFKAWNSFLTIDHEGNVLNTYDKHHLVPFGEYTPSLLSDSLSFLGLGMLVEGFSYSKGEGLKTLHMKGTPSVGVLICYEIIFPGKVVNKADRPDWLLNITNDAWYGSFNGPYQHLVQTRVRAIEEGLPIVRSAGTGISAVIDANGRVVKALGLNQQGAVISALPAARQSHSLFYKDSILGFYLLVLLCYSFGILFKRQ